MQEKSDTQLLREYTGQKSEPAFGELVRRHADMVYSAALRQVQSPDWAGEIAQGVFIDLARKSGRLADQRREDGSLAGWLYRATRFAALNLLREERRRQSGERQLMENAHALPDSGPDWKSLEPLLDEAMSALNENERDALILRFLKNQNFRDVGAALGVNDDTAQKRVARSLEKLRAAFARRGVTTTCAALASGLAANAVQAAPAGLSTMWIGASLAGASAESGLTLTLLKIMSMTKLQIGLSALAVGGLAVTAAVENHTANKVRSENVALQQQLASLTADNQALASQPPPPANSRLPDDQFQELLRLRGEASRFGEQTNLVSKLQDEAGKLREENGNLQSRAQAAEGILKFQSNATAIMDAAKLLGLAARVWASDHNNIYPTNYETISNQLGGLYTNAILSTFELLNVGKARDTYPNAIFAREITPRATPYGGWQRDYLFCDGSVQAAASVDGDFSAWEQSNTIPIPDPQPQ